MDLRNQCSLSGLPSSVAKRKNNFKADHVNFSTFFFFRDCYTFRCHDYYSFKPLSFTLTLAGDHKVRGKQNLWASFTTKHFSVDQNEI